MLSPIDEFAICAFHENQQWFDPFNAMAEIMIDTEPTGRGNVTPPPSACMFTATPENLSRAKVRFV